jgi:hypothetical protein
MSHREASVPTGTVADMDADAELDPARKRLGSFFNGR